MGEKALNWGISSVLIEDPRKGIGRHLAEHVNANQPCSCGCSEAASLEMLTLPVCSAPFGSRLV